MKRSKLTYSCQILSITCDNASANDAMITHLAELLPGFPGQANRTRCFAHILNLVAKCIMRQFDAPKKAKTKRISNEEDLDDLTWDSTNDLETDELESDSDDEDNEEDLQLEEEIAGEDDDVANEDGRDEMTMAEIEQLEESVKPVRRVLTKVMSHDQQTNPLAHLILALKGSVCDKRSTTIILPEWFAILD